jgi:hypothetical protein
MSFSQLNAELIAAEINPNTRNDEIERLVAEVGYQIQGIEDMRQQAYQMLLAGQITSEQYQGQEAQVAQYLTPLVKKRDLLTELHRRNDQPF